MRRLVRWIGVLLLLLIVGVAVAAPPYIDAVAFIARAANLGGYPGQVAVWRAQAFVADPVRQIPTRHGMIDTRMYRPASGRHRRAVTLVPGVHMDGIRETRLVGMAEDLAASGFSVLTVSTPDLQQFRITPASTDIIEDAAKWLANQTGTSVGMLGISFSGGLSVVAAGRPELRDHVSFVMSFGGHGDMRRVMRYIAGGSAPAMPDVTAAERLVPGADHLSIKPPHDYAVAVVLLGLVDRLVPRDQVDALRRGILTFLSASSLTLVDMSRAEIEFQRARDLASTLPEPSRTLMTHVNNRAVEKLGPVLLPVVDGLTTENGDPAMSPERSPAPAAPLFLLHGSEDTVIPSVETVLLATAFRDKTEVHALLSGLITHAEVDRAPTMTEMWRLVTFWKVLMAQ